MLNPALSEYLESRRCGLSLRELERQACGLPTFFPSWPPPAGAGWIVFLVALTRDSAAVWADDERKLRSLAEELPLSLWFPVPREVIEASLN